MLIAYYVFLAIFLLASVSRFVMFVSFKYAMALTCLADESLAFLVYVSRQRRLTESEKHQLGIKLEETISQVSVDRLYKTFHRIVFDSSGIIRTKYLDSVLELSLRLSKHISVQRVEYESEIEFTSESKYGYISQQQAANMGPCLV